MSDPLFWMIMGYLAVMAIGGWLVGRHVRRNARLAQLKIMERPDAKRQ
jgi:hypothetical protein